MNTTCGIINAIANISQILTQINESLSNHPANSNQVKFYTITDIMKMTGWSEMTVQKLFNDPKFPTSDFGKTKLVEENALINYFSVKHIKERDRYWMKEVPNAKNTISKKKP